MRRAEEENIPWQEMRYVGKPPPTAEATDAVRRQKQPFGWEIPLLRCFADMMFSCVGVAVQ